MMSCVNAARHPHVPAGAPTGAGGSTRVLDPATGRGVPDSPPARRHRRPSWRDPRLLVGLALVSGSVLLGARLLAAADDTVQVWAAEGHLAAGDALVAADLTAADVRFTREEQAARYLPADAVPEGLVLARDVAAGELLPRAALTEREGEPLAELPIAVASEAVPTGLHPGELVDVWVTPAGTAEEGRRAVRVLEQVRVVAAPRSSSALGPATTRQVVVGVPGDDDDLLARALAELSGGTAVLVRRG